MRHPGIIMSPDIFLDLRNIYVHIILMNKKNQYPEWVEKYRGKGRTIRKVRNGYGLYKCTSKYDPVTKGPKLVQTYLGMITEADGFIPKKSVSSHPSYIEYGLSHVIWKNFKRTLVRSTFTGDEAVVRLGIIFYIFGAVREELIPLTFISDGVENELSQRLSSTSQSRIRAVSNKIEALFSEKIPDRQDRILLDALLRMCVMESNNRRSQIPSLPEEAAKLMERYGLKYE